MVDVAEGDCYVVDLFDGTAWGLFVEDVGKINDFKEAKNWRRFVIDTGKAKQGRRLGVIQRAVYGELPESPTAPWNQISDKIVDEKGPNLPPISGILITHLDSDHAGNAGALVRSLQALKPEPKPKLMGNSPPMLPMYMSLMVTWTEQLNKENLLDSDSQFYIRRWRLERFCNVVHVPIYEGPEWRPATDPNADSTKHLSKIIVRITHLDQIVEATGYAPGRTFKNLLELAKQAGCSILYRFNLLDMATSENTLKDILDNKEYRTKALDAQQIQTYTTSNKTIWQPGGEAYVGIPFDVMKKAETIKDKVWIKVLVEVSLKPQNRFHSLIRSSLSEKTISAAIPIEGRWLRYVHEIQVAKLKPKTTPVFNILRGIDWGRIPYIGPPTPLEASEKAVKSVKPNSEKKTGKKAVPTKKTKKTKQEPAEKPEETTAVQPTGTAGPSDNSKLLKELRELDPDNGFKVPDRPDHDWVTNNPNYIVVGLEDDLLPIRYLRGHYQTSRLGCAGKNFVRDLAHLILQVRLLTTETVQEFEKKKQQKKAENAAIKAAKAAKKNPTNIEEEDEKKDEAGEDGENKDDEVTDVIIKKSLRGSESWSEYTNRASILAQFIYDDKKEDDKQPSADVGSKFSMLFTGDAFEQGQDETTYGHNARVSTRTVETTQFAHPNKDPSPLAQPDGSLLSWLWRQNYFTSYRVDVLKVPHHGSSTTTSASFYQFVSASIYLISCSASLHRHPRPETIQAILATILREDGPVTKNEPKNFRSKSNNNDQLRPISQVCSS